MLCESWEFRREVLPAPVEQRRDSERDHSVGGPVLFQLSLLVMPAQGCGTELRGAPFSLQHGASRMCWDLCWVIGVQRAAGCHSALENRTPCACRQGDVGAHGGAGGAGTIMGETVAVPERVTVVSGTGARGHGAGNVGG